MVDPGSNYKKLEKEVEEFTDKFGDILIELASEDKRRNLLTLEDRPASLMDYPIFGGKDSQCYFKYEEEMRRALKVNKVPLVDQVSKIRASLSGHPLSMVPESVKLAEDAFKTLRQRYGDEERVLVLRLKDLKKSGDRPPSPMGQVAWYTELIGKLQRLLELGSQSDDLAAMAFSKDVFDTVFRLFPHRELAKLSQRSEVHGKRTKRRMGELVKMLEEKRDEANLVDKVMGSADKPPPGGGGLGGSGGLGKRGNNAQQVGLRENHDCRVCKYLRDNSWQGAHPLFKNHLDLTPMGCPNFLSVSFRNRSSIALSIKLCLNCLDPKITYTKNHNAACDKKVKAELQCKFQGCNRNVWLCDQHKHEPANAAVIKKMKETVARQGWTLGMVSVMSPKPSPASSPSPKRRSKVSEVSKSPKTANKAQLGKPESTAVGEEAVEANRAKLRTKGITVLEEPKGRPMFQFFMREESPSQS